MVILYAGPSLKTAQITVYTMAMFVIVLVTLTLILLTMILKCLYDDENLPLFDEMYPACTQGTVS